MTAIQELEDPTLSPPLATRKAGRARVHQDRTDTYVQTVSLYKYLDVRELFREFSVRLCNTTELNRVRLENRALDLELEHRCATHRSVCGDFMLRYTLQFEGELLGTLILNRNHQFLSAEIRHIRRIIDSLLGPLNNATKYLRVWQSAYHDALTGVRNRASLDLLLSGVETTAGITAMLVCDVDRFKSINDQYGHTCGDRVLVEFVRLLTTSAGRSATIYRYGGDEFVVVFRCLHSDGGVGIAEQVRQTVMNTPLKIDGREIAITTTVGLTEVRENEALDEAFLRADSALLHGKRTTRNVVVSA